MKTPAPGNGAGVIVETRTEPRRLDTPTPRSTQASRRRARFAHDATRIAFGSARSRADFDPNFVDRTPAEIAVARRMAAEGA
jgi:hypothetical protein